MDQLGAYQNLLQGLVGQRRARMQALQPQEEQQPQPPPWAMEELRRRMGYPSPQDTAAEENRRWDLTFGQGQAVSAAQIAQLTAALETERARTRAIMDEMARGGRKEQAESPYYGPKAAGDVAETASRTGQNVAVTKGVEQGTQFAAERHPLSVEHDKLLNRDLGARIAPEEALAAKYVLRAPSKKYPGRFIKPETGEPTWYQTQAEEDAGGVATRTRNEGETARVETRQRENQLTLAEERYLRDPQVSEKEKFAYLLTRGGKAPVSAGGQPPPPDRAAAMTEPGQRISYGTYDISGKKTAPGDYGSQTLLGPKKPTLEEQALSGLTPGDRMQFLKQKEANASRERIAKQQADLKARELALKDRKFKSEDERANAILSVRTEQNRLRAAELGFKVDTEKANLEMRQAGLNQRDRAAIMSYAGLLMATMNPEMQKQGMAIASDPGAFLESDPKFLETARAAIKEDYPTLYGADKKFGPEPPPAGGKTKTPAPAGKKISPPSSVSGNADFERDTRRLDTLPTPEALVEVKKQKSAIVQAYGAEAYNFLESKYTPGVQPKVGEGDSMPEEYKKIKLPPWPK